MNRPKYKHIRMKGKDTTYLLNHTLNYRNELEKYCDELEQSNKSLSNAYDDCLTTLHFWEEEYHIYRKALDKACELLEDCPLSTLDEELDCNNCTDDYANCWKEWALKDD